MQAAHAAVAFCAQHPVPADCTLVLLAARDEFDLVCLLADAERTHSDAVAFREPDKGMSITAVALTSSRLCRKFPLAFSVRGGGEK